MNEPGKICSGDVVIVSFPFSDLSDSKRRPAVVLVELEGEDIILCQISSQRKVDKYAVPLHSEDFIYGQLFQESLVRTNKLFTLNRGLILYKVGVLREERFRSISSAVRALFSP